MKTRALDGNWDWKMGKGLQDYVDEALGVAYTVKMKVLSWLGDCFFDATAGIDWKNILGAKNSKEQADNSIKDIVLAEPEIVELTYFESSVEDRKYTCTMRFKTVYGETIEVKI